MSEPMTEDRRTLVGRRTRSIAIRSGVRVSAVVSGSTSNSRERRPTSLMTSGMVNSPMRAGTSGTPPCRLGSPKVNRTSPPTGAMPTVPSSTPRAPPMRPLSPEPVLIPTDDRQPEDRHPEVLLRTEPQREVGERRRQEDEDEHADQAAHDQTDGGGDHRLLAAALLGHAVALEGGRDRARGAGGVDEDRREGPAVDRARVERAEQDETRGGVHGEGERHEQRQTHRRAQDGYRADRHARDGAEQDEQQRHRAQQADEPGQGITHRAAPATRAAPRTPPSGSRSAPPTPAARSSPGRRPAP